jgi:hypothetical protein
LLKECGEDLAMRAASRVDFQLTGLYRDGSMIRNVIEQAVANDETDRAALTEKRASLAKEITRAERAIERYQDAFENGDLDPARFKQRLSALDTRLDGRPSPRARTGRRHAHNAGYGHPPCRRQPTRSRHRSRRAGASEGLLAILIADLRVNSRTEVLPTYRVGAPMVCASTRFARRQVQWKVWVRTHPRNHPESTSINRLWQPRHCTFLHRIVLNLDDVSKTYLRADQPQPVLLPQLEHV